MSINSFLKKIVPKVSWGEETTVTKSSKSVVRGYYPNLRNKQRASDEDLDVILEMFRKDPVINTAVTIRVYSMINSGYRVKGSKKDLNLLENLRFNYSFLKKLVFNGVLYRHLITEVVNNSLGKPVELHVLDTPTIEAVYDRNGDIKSFVQRAPDGKDINFNIDEVAFMALDSITHSVWGEVPLKSLYRTITTKGYVENFINYLAQTNAWRDMMVTTMDGDALDELMPHYFNAKADPDYPFIVQKPKSPDQVFEIKQLRTTDDIKNFLELLEYLRTQILMLLKVPPIVVGIPDNSNRSNSDAQLKAFNMANEADRKQIADYINYELFPKIGVKGTFEWKPIDKRSEKEDIEIVEKLINMGANPKMMEEFLRNAGLELPEGELFVNPVVKKPDDAPSRPSRARKDEGERNQTIGTGSESTTRPDQLS